MVLDHCLLGRATLYGILEPVDVVGYVGGRRVPAGVDAFLDPFLFQTVEDGSATALSRQLARLLMLGSRWLSLQERRMHYPHIESLDPSGSKPCGRRLRTAFITASRTSLNR